MANKTYSVSVKFNANTATDTHAINAKLFVMLWESPATIYDARELEIEKITLVSFDCGHMMVTDEQAEKVSDYLVDSLYKMFTKNKSDYVLPTWNLSNSGDDNV